MMIINMHYYTGEGNLVGGSLEDNLEVADWILLGFGYNQVGLVDSYMLLLFLVSCFDLDSLELFQHLIS